MVSGLCCPSDCGPLHSWRGSLGPGLREEENFVSSLSEQITDAEHLRLDDEKWVRAAGKRHTARLTICKTCLRLL